MPHTNIVFFLPHLFGGTHCLKIKKSQTCPPNQNEASFVEII